MKVFIEYDDNGFFLWDQETMDALNTDFQNTHTLVEVPLQLVKEYKDLELANRKMNDRLEQYYKKRRELENVATVG